MTTFGGITTIVLVKNVAFFGRRQFDMGNPGDNGKGLAIVKGARSGKLGRTEVMP